MNFKLTLSIFSLTTLQVLGTSNKVVVGYYADWETERLPPSKVSYDKLTHINYAFALFTNKDYQPKVKGGDVLKDLVKRAHKKQVKVLVSIGGWDGSKFFSKMVSNLTNRDKFIKGTLALVNKFDLDGVDLDWEFPGRVGAEGNLVTPNDSKNYLKLLKELRAALGEKLLTAAVRVEPFDGADGYPMKNVKQFANWFDFINVMTYDINGPWSTTTGPVCGLDFVEGKGESNSVKQAVKDWNTAGFPKSKLVVGIPFYGYAGGVEEDMTKTDQYAPITNTALPSYAYHDLYDKNVLITAKTANTQAGWTRTFDTKTQTPWLFNKKTKTFIGYDDIDSLKAKTDYVKCNGYLGVMVWALDNDYNDELLNALQNVHNSETCTLKKESQSRVTNSSYKVSTPTKVRFNEPTKII